MATSTVFAIVFAAFAVSCAIADASPNQATAAVDPSTGGSRYVSQHSFLKPVLPRQINPWGDPEIKEWHFHVYWHLPARFETAGANDSYVAAMRVRDELIDHVRAGDFVVVLDGVTNDVLPKVNVSNIPPVNHVPTGPHPCGSYEVWTPIESLGKAMSFFMRRRSELTVLLHPLSGHAVEDHTGRAMWLGPEYRLNLNVLPELGGDAPQYPELGLGYHGGGRID